MSKATVQCHRNRPRVVRCGRLFIRTGHLVLTIGIELPGRPFLKQQFSGSVVRQHSGLRPHSANKDERR